MADKMLIDASHAEETRVVVVRGNRIEEFDFESQHKKQIRGNIYLAKVTRVEPSLQAAFVDYGGNRHGFLAFAEIHPDYYQIPLADRQALLRAEAEEARRDEDIEHVETAPVPAQPVKIRQETPVEIEAAEVVETVDVAETIEAAEVAEAEAAPVEEETKPKARKPRKPRAKKAAAKDEAAEPAEASAADDEDGKTPSGDMAAAVDTDVISEDVRKRSNDDDDDDDDHHEEKEVIESVGAEDAMEEVPDRIQRKPRKQYRIQEVIKRRQILLVQVAKEERGNKGAALTTYLSLAGRYSVLMPNTARGGGISRKITNPQDRKRLKEIARDLEVPQGMGVILRTAGANRTKVEVKRDFEYLMRLWENVRTLTLNSTAPCLVYEEGSLIKRSIRDLYNKDISEVVVAGEEGYKEAKAFMKMLMPSHAKVVQPYRDIHPIFSRSGIEAQLDRMLQPQVTLRSGGYIIINQTEALVSIDVNSGRSTREHSIEETALQTNLEASEEVARQLRLRDLAGLVVIDFIDMEEKRNNRAVEKRLKDCLKHDRARIQVGRISHFGLLEMSRQRIRASVLESTMQTCPHCNGTGHVRSQSSVALHVLRGVEEYLLKNTTHNITVRTTPDIALYLLNQKRGTINDYETRFGVHIVVDADAHVGAQHFAIDRGEPVENPVRIDQFIQFAPEPDEDDDIVIEEEIDEEAEVVAAPVAAAASEASSDDQSGRKRKRRRRRRGGRGQDAAEGSDTASFGGEQPGDEDEDGDEGEGEAGEAGEAGTDAVSADGEGKRKRRRRGKRGGRRNRGDEAEGTAGAEASDDAGSEDGVEAVSASGSVDLDAAAEAEVESQAQPAAAEAVVTEAVVENAVVEPAPKARRTRKAKAAPAEAGTEAATVEATKVEVPKAPADAAAQAAVEEKPAEEVVAEEPTVEEAAVEEAAAVLDDQKPARANRGLSTTASAPVVKSSTTQEKDGDEPEKPKKGGWWQRRGFF